MFGTKLCGRPEKGSAASLLPSQGLDVWLWAQTLRMSKKENCIQDVDGWGVFCHDIACAMTSLITLWPSFVLDCHFAGTKANKQRVGAKANIPRVLNVEDVDGWDASIK